MAITLKGSSTKTTAASHPARTISGWGRCATGVVFQGADCGSDGSALTCIAGGTSAQTSTRSGVWIYGPLAAQTLSGTITTTIRGKVGVFTNIYKAVTAAYIMKPCGTLRHAVLTGLNRYGTCWTTTQADYTSCALTIVACAVATAGDYLVLEAGYSNTCFLCSCVGTVQSGSTGPHTRWVFSGNVTLQTGVPNSLMRMGFGT